MLKHSSSSLSLLYAIWQYLSLRRRIQFGMLLTVMIATGLSEIFSLGMVIPFLSMLSNPSELWNHPFARRLSDLIGLSSSDDLLLAVTFLFAAASVLAASARLTNLWMNGVLASAIGSELSCEAYRRTIYQPYSLHVQRNSAALITGVTTFTSQTVSAINAFLQLTTSLVVSAGLFVAMLFIDATVILSAGVLLVSIYAILAVGVRAKLRQNSQIIAYSATNQLKALQEGFSSIRDVLLSGNQDNYLRIYRRWDLPQRELQATNAFLSFFPRYVLEALSMVAISLIGLALALQHGEGVTLIPTLGALALGAQRLLPALQQIFISWAALKIYSAGVQGVLEMLRQPMPLIVSHVKPFQLRNCISFEDVHFSYTSGPEVIKGLNVKIHAGQRIGLIGSTGQGKTTMIDLLIGLLVPTSGRIVVDGRDLHKYDEPELLASWKTAISYVPQNISMSDYSILENIAFSVPFDTIDLERVRKAADQAQISNFIESMPDGYNTLVGENGIRLSGGQRQRIAIARALYKQAKILILDEATSALDSDTERAIINDIYSSTHDVTVVMIAHRLSTLQRCDKVFHINNGLVEAEGPPEEMLYDGKIPLL